MADNTAQIVLTANTSKFASEFSRAANSARSAAGQITNALNGIKGAMGALGVGLSFAGMAAFVKNSIDAADALNDLSKRTGVAATTIGGIGFAAQQAGGDLEGAAVAFKSFNKTISEALGGNREAIDNFAKLGISLKDLKSLSPDKLLIKAADAFSQFADGAEKAAGATVFFGKGAASVAGLLDEGGASLQRNIEYYKRYSGVTDELVVASDQFNDSLTKLNLIVGSLGRYLAKELLGPMQRLVEYLIDARQNSDGFESAAKKLADALKGVAVASAEAWYFTKNLGDALAYNALQSANVAKLMSGQGGLQDAINLFKERQRNVAAFREELASVLKLLEGGTGSRASGIGGVGNDPGVTGGPGRRRAPNFTGSKPGGQTGLDEYARQLERVKKLTAEAGAELEALFSGEKLNAAAKALAQLSQDETFKKLPEQQRREIEAWYARYDALLKNIEAEEKFADARAEQQKQSDESRRKRAEDIVQFGKSVEAYKLQNDTMTRELALVGQSVEAHQKLAEIIAFEAMEREANRLGITSQMDELRKAMQERLKLIDEMAAKVREFNNTEQIRSIFAENFADQLSQVVEGTKSLAEAFKDMERQIVASISRIAAQNIAEAIFGKAGGTGGFGDFASFFGKMLSGAFASGTNFAPGGMALVGERGPEIVNLPRGASVTPNNKIGGNVISINVNVPGGTSRASADQIALQTGVAVQRAMARIG